MGHDGCMTETMNAIAYSASLPISDPASLEDVTVPVPELRARDLLVEVKAVSVNPADVKVRANMDPGGTPTVLGFDASGVVRAVGPEVTLFQVGEEGYYAGSNTRPGSNSALHAVDERIVGHKPASLNFAEAAALPLTTITAWEGLFEKLKIAADSTGTLLVVGGAGGVGSMVIQLVKAVAPGIRVIASATRPETREWVRALGADDTVNHGDALHNDVAQVAPEGIDYIFSTNSTGQLTPFVSILNPFGQVVSIDGIPQGDFGDFQRKSLSWHTELMFTRSAFQTPDMVKQHELLEKVSALVEAGTVRTTLTSTLSPFTAEQLRAAHAQVESGRMLGKVVVATGK